MGWRGLVSASDPLPCLPEGLPVAPQVLTVWQQLDLSIAVRGLSHSKWKFMKNWWTLSIILFFYCFLAFLLQYSLSLSLSHGLALPLSHVIWTEEQRGLNRGIDYLNGLKVKGEGSLGQEGRAELGEEICIAHIWWVLTVMPGLRVGFSIQATNKCTELDMFV